MTIGQLIGFQKGRRSVPRGRLGHAGRGSRLGLACTAVQRNKLERLARYVARPTIALERLAFDPAGRVVLELTRPFRDGTTHMVFSPEYWLAHLAAARDAAPAEPFSSNCSRSASPTSTSRCNTRRSSG